MIFRQEHLVKNRYIYIALMLLWMFRSDIFAQSGYLSQIISADVLSWIEKWLILCIIAGIWRIVWKRAKLVHFQHKVKASIVQPIIADGIIQEVKVDRYDDGYRNKWANSTPNYNRSCKIQWAIPGFGELKEEYFTFNLLQTFIPSDDISGTWNTTDLSDISSEWPVIKFIQQYIKIWAKVAIVIDPNNMALYYVDDPLLQYKLVPFKRPGSNIADSKIASWIIKKLVIPIAILMPVGIVILLLISTQV